jgi:hypothetical protein
MLNLQPTRKPRRAVPLEKNVQAQIVRLLRSVGAKVYVIGRPPRRDSVHKGTGQTPGICDLEIWLPTALGHRELVKVEVKRPGGDPRKKRSPEQVEYAEYCRLAGVTYVCGGVDEVLQLLQARGLVREVPEYRRTLTNKAGAS